jgi:hypothetical protein
MISANRGKRIHERQSYSGKAGSELGGFVDYAPTAATPLADDLAARQGRQVGKGKRGLPGGSSRAKLLAATGRKGSPETGTTDAGSEGERG